MFIKFRSTWIEEKRETIVYVQFNHKHNTIHCLGVNHDKDSESKVRRQKGALRNAIENIDRNVRRKIWNHYFATQSKKAMALVGTK
jgi:hypothetical protein